VTTQASSRHIRFRSRSIPVLALEAEAPLSAWMIRLDTYLAHSPAFFARTSIMIDVTNLGLDRSGVIELVKGLTERGIRVMGLTGVDLAWASDDLPPILTGERATAIPDEPKRMGDGRSSEGGDSSELTANEQAAFQQIASAIGVVDNQHSKTAQEREPSSEPVNCVPLIVNAPVRSGQTIFYPQGDVTVIGSVSSGADVIAGGSIHIYGTLRGRAMAGAYGETRARIFCRRLEAELLAVGGVYLTADEIDTNVHHLPVQAWLENEYVRIARID
jgi:septum site-determining protein MinC